MSESKEGIKCKVCKKLYSSNTSLTVHMRIHNETRPYVCGTCGRGFRQRVHMRDHERSMHLKVKDYICDVCSMSFTVKTHLQRHMNTHTREHIYQCTICEKSYFERRSLKHHLLTKHEIDNPSNIDIKASENPFISEVGPQQCHLCPEMFANKSKLDIHLKLHAGVLPFNCQVCAKGFATKKQLREHARVHSQLRRYRCPLCDKAFNYPTVLRRHMKKHSNVKDFCCNVCGKTFGQKCNLEYHLRIHNNEKIYKCEICQKAFISRGNLKRHFKIHTLEKPYECEVCLKKFSERSTLLGHMKVHEKTATHTNTCKPNRNDEIRFRNDFISAMNTCRLSNALEAPGPNGNTNVDMKLESELIIPCGPNVTNDEMVLGVISGMSTCGSSNAVKVLGPNRETNDEMRLETTPMNVMNNEMSPKSDLISATNTCKPNSVTHDEMVLGLISGMSTCGSSSSVKVPGPNRDTNDEMGLETTAMDAGNNEMRPKSDLSSVINTRKPNSVTHDEMVLGIISDMNTCGSSNTMQVCGPNKDTNDEMGLENDLIIPSNSCGTDDVAKDEIRLETSPTNAVNNGMRSKIDLIGIKSTCGPNSVTNNEIGLRENAISGLSSTMEAPGPNSDPNGEMRLENDLIISSNSCGPDVKNDKMGLKSTPISVFSVNDEMRLDTYLLSGRNTCKPNSVTNNETELEEDAISGMSSALKARKPHRDTNDEMRLESDLIIPSNSCKPNNVTNNHEMRPKSGIIRVTNTCEPNSGTNDEMEFKDDPRLRSTTKTLFATHELLAMLKRDQTQKLHGLCD